MTPVLRTAFPVAPMHLTNAPEAGTGKGYLADIASATATGERCAVISLAPNPEETEKRLIGAALAGYPIIAIDNVRVLLEGDFLCQVTERPLLQLRRLASSDQIRVANTFTPLANGNNATVADDLVRRTISCTLDANMEKPDERTFSTNPLAMVLNSRGAYIAAILTIARAYPVETMETARGADPVRQDRVTVFAAWRDELGFDQQHTPPILLNSPIVDTTMISPLSNQHSMPPCSQSLPKELTLAKSTPYASVSG
jgi:hypothetical protein